MYKSRFEDGGEIGDYYKTQFNSLDAGPDATAVSEAIANQLFKYYTQLDPNVFDNINPAIQNPFQKAAQTTLIGGNYDDFSAEALLQFKNLYTPAELNSIVDSYVEQTGDTETGAILKNLFGSDTSLSDTAIANAGKIPLGEGDITAAGNTTSQLNKIGSDAANAKNPFSNISGSDLLKYGLPALASYLSYKSAKDAQEQARGASFSANGPTTATRTTYGGSRYSAAQGGVASLAGGGEVSQPFYLGGSTDGMADEVPAHIDNKRPAALSDGEFVVPADVVSHLGNGNSNAGAKRLYEMMDRIREARTGNSKQGIQVNPNNFMPG